MFVTHKTEQRFYSEDNQEDIWEDIVMAGGKVLLWMDIPSLHLQETLSWVWFCGTLFVHESMQHSLSSMIWTEAHDLANV